MYINVQTRRVLVYTRGGYRAAGTSKMERFVIIVNGFQPLIIITKCSILDVAVALDPPLYILHCVFKTFSPNEARNIIIRDE